MDETPYVIGIDPAERDGTPVGVLEDESVSATGDEDADEPPETISPLDELTDDQWATMDDDLAAFLDGTDTGAGSDSDSESVCSDNSTTSETRKVQKKRKRTTNSTDASEAEESDSSVNSTSRLQRRKKRTMERVTSLTNVVTADKSSGLPSPETTGPEEGQGEDDEIGPEAEQSAPDYQDDYDDGLEAELLAGFDSGGEE